MTTVALVGAGPGLSAAIHQVLQGMRFLGRGTILFINGGSAARPNPNVAGTSIAFAGQSAYATMLHTVLTEENIHVGQLIIPGAITDGDQPRLAEELWALHTQRDQFRIFADPIKT